MYSTSPSYCIHVSYFLLQECVNRFINLYDLTLYVSSELVVKKCALSICVKKKFILQMVIWSVIL